jgi:hypothetical protein
MKTLLRSATFALLAIAVCTASAGAQVVKCQRSIAKATHSSCRPESRPSKMRGRRQQRAKSRPPSETEATRVDPKADGKMHSPQELAKTAAAATKRGGGTIGLRSPGRSAGQRPACPNWEGHCINPSPLQRHRHCLACIGGASGDQAMVSTDASFRTAARASSASSRWRRPRLLNSRQDLRSAGTRANGGTATRVPIG